MSWFNKIWANQPLALAGDVGICSGTGAIRLLSCGFDAEDEVDLMFDHANVSQMKRSHAVIFLKHFSELPAVLLRNL